jgi:MYXO-CTERM domain-containing protein
MKRLILGVSLVALMLGGAVQTAQAVPLTGKVDYLGTFTVNNPTFLPPASQVAILDAFSLNPLNVTGDIATFITPPDQFDYHAPIIDFDPVVAPILPLWSHNGLSFDLTTFGIDEREGDVLVLKGTGIFKAAGFDDTLGNWVMTLNLSGKSASGTYSASSAIPEPGLLGLLGLGLLGLARSVRTRR